ncbi:hypothetical protein PAHAL_2G441500 [Panicum hallii]|uniref:Uncharacterized protein n=1 Tax=Panicum hallii TaxID=206008 RepID=A0A2T8KST9_9POAL|nr:hypothetical protein PAHAL_2G441500 [Panicum hallii]
MAFPATPARKLLLPGSSAVARRVAAGFDLDGAGDFFSGLWQLVRSKAAELVAYLAALFSALARKLRSTSSFRRRPAPTHSGSGCTSPSPWRSRPRWASSCFSTSPDAAGAAAAARAEAAAA